jgi:hypothetical protein
MKLKKKLLFNFLLFGSTIRSSLNAKNWIFSFKVLISLHTLLPLGICHLRWPHRLTLSCARAHMSINKCTFQRYKSPYSLHNLYTLFKFYFTFSISGKWASRSGTLKNVRTCQQRCCVMNIQKLIMSMTSGIIVL